MTRAGRRRLFSWGLMNYRSGDFVAPRLLPDDTSGLRRLRLGEMFGFGLGLARRW
jgi:hypothetical protein